MPIGSQHLEIFSQVTVDGCRFGRRFYDEQFDNPILMFNLKQTRAKPVAIMFGKSLA
jgi:hypothetical protein